MKICEQCKKEKSKYKCQYNTGKEYEVKHICKKCISKLIKNYKIDYILSV